VLEEGYVSDKQVSRSIVSDNHRSLKQFLDITVRETPNTSKLGNINEVAKKRSSMSPLTTRENLILVQSEVEPKPIFNQNKKVQKKERPPMLHYRRVFDKKTSIITPPERHASQRSFLPKLT